ncbi:LOW QUALITY PROTEIN: hypothetical protein CVT26_004346, partial [Gymnopilus dilepis]
RSPVQDFLTIFVETDQQLELREVHQRVRDECDIGVVDRERANSAHVSQLQTPSSMQRISRCVSLSKGSCLKTNGTPLTRKRSRGLVERRVRRLDERKKGTTVLKHGWERPYAENLNVRRVPDNINGAGSGYTFNENFFSVSSGFLEKRQSATGSPFFAVDNGRNEWESYTEEKKSFTDYDDEGDDGMLQRQFFASRRREAEMIVCNFHLRQIGLLPFAAIINYEFAGGCEEGSL